MGAVWASVHAPADGLWLREERRRWLESVWLLVDTLNRQGGDENAQVHLILVLYYRPYFISPFAAADCTVF